MKRENILLVLWIVFGFLLLTAINSMLYFLVNLIYFGLYELGVSYSTLKIVIPISTLILYGLTMYIVLKRVDISSKISGIYLMKFPIILAVILGVIAFALKPITKELENYHRAYSGASEDWYSQDYLEFYNWLNAGLGISRSLVIIILLIVLIPKLRDLNSKQNSIEKSQQDKNKIL